MQPIAKVVIDDLEDRLNSSSLHHTVTVTVTVMVCTSALFHDAIIMTACCAATSFLIHP